DIVGPASLLATATAYSSSACSNRAGSPDTCRATRCPEGAQAQQEIILAGRPGREGRMDSDRRAHPTNAAIDRLPTCSRRLGAAASTVQNITNAGARDHQLSMIAPLLRRPLDVV